ncbi:MAG: protein kinase [Alphaproteobacteria bacterium]|nr:protein kinase [Alphaproteobacteria bacterium]
MSRDADRTWESTDETPLEPSAGDPLASGPDRYEDRATLGEGALGRVIATHDRVLDRVVARKELVRDQPGAAERFVAEARVTAGLEHPSIPPVYEAGRLPDGTPYYTMKRVEGRSMRAAIAEATTLPARLELVDAVLRAVQAMAYAHAQGVLHRDLKPDNVLLGRYGETWVVDWGLAHRADGPPTTGIAGTPGYMSPEQARGEPVGPPSDVWSLGALLHAVLAGRRPFGPLSGREAMARVRSEGPPPLASVVPEVPPELAAVVDKALSFDPTHRYPDAGGLAADLEAWVSGRRVAAYAYSPWQVLARELWRHRWRVAAALAVLALLAGVLVEADRRQRDGARRALDAERREQRATERALAESLVAAGRVALAEGNTLLAGADGAVALRYADLPEARGLVARTLAAGTPRPVDALDAGHPCRWLARGPDLVVCGGDGGITAFVDGERRWHRDEQTIDGVLTADGTRLVASLTTVEGGAVEVLSAADGSTSQAFRSASDTPRAVAWVGERPVWAEGGTLVDGVNQVMFCNSNVTDLQVDASGRLNAVCANGGYGVFRPDDLTRIEQPATSQLGVAFALTPDGRGAWMGVDRSVRRVGPDADGGEPIDVGGYTGALALSPDGRWLVASTDRQEVRWIDRVRGGAPSVLPTGATRTGLAFEPDGTLWVSGARGPMRWSPPAPPAIEQAEGVTSIVPAGDDAVLATAGGRLERLEVVGPGRKALLDLGFRVHLYPVGREVYAADSLFRQSWRISLDGDIEERPRRDAHIGRLGGVVGDALLWGVQGTDEVVVTDVDLRELAREHLPRVAPVDGHVVVRGTGAFEELAPTTLRPLRRIEVPAVTPPISDDWDVVGYGVDGTWWLGDRSGVIAVHPDGRAARVDHPMVGMATLADGRVVLGGWDGTWTVVDDDRVVAVLPGTGAHVGNAYLVGPRLVTTDWDGLARTWDPTVFDADGADLWQRVLPNTGYDWVDGRIVSR